MNDKGIVVLSLFDGISAGRLALERAGIPIERYYASEIDKYAISITQYNYPDTIQLGDVEKIDFTQFEGEIDLLIGGSPCTNLSIAGNRKGLEGDESRLFWEYVRAIKECKPKYFFLENVESMTDSDKEIISKEMGMYPICINSALLSGQNRKRYYWFNWGKKQINLFGFPTCDIPQPENKGILLKDVLEKNTIAPDEKSRAVISSIGRTTEREYFRKNQGQLVAEPIGVNVLNKGTKIKNVLDKSYTIWARDYKGFNNCGMTGVLEPIRLSQYEKSKGQAQRVYSIRGKSVVINGNGGGQGGKTGLYKIDLPDGDYIIRKLTPIECERLQTMPDGWTEYGIEGRISNTNRYKCIGNSWTVDVISYILSYLKNELTP